MSLNSWFQALRWGSNRTCSTRARRPQRSAPRRPFRPCLGVLEGRDLPSTFPVTNLLDSGPGSLRAAIAAANANPGADTISFAGGLRGTIALAGGQLSITDALTIDGPGAWQLAVSGDDASRVFRVAGSAGS